MNFLSSLNNFCVSEDLVDKSCVDSTVPRYQVATALASVTS